MIVNLKLNTIVDFRTDFEISREPDDTSGLSVETIRIPMGNISKESSMTMFSVLNSANSTETINMRKIFGPDRSVITPDNNNIEATFIIAKKIDGAPGSTGTVETSINFKEQ